jgi:hypothetical protein
MKLLITFAITVPDKTHVSQFAGVVESAKSALRAGMSTGVEVVGVRRSNDSGDATKSVSQFRSKRPA